MNDPKQSGSSDFEGLDQWLAQFLDDPFAGGSSHSFRTDVYETSSQYIIEADLSDLFPACIKVIKGDQCLTIQTYCRKKMEKEALVFLPFCLSKREMSASYADGILEVFIRKNEDLEHLHGNHRITLKPKQR
ncbi:hypothetical protein CEF21_12495 [Bacillus sp. FJAT-42376]|uniref:Hsp20/alpha crystallin family protein n=1 Tax=Bacillus sp. FJAT-42376 TaxID=2014076 RepID=UPI000F4E01C9|nr:Hsp20/alpha crystallin family protein [Bacillus sp. FJAT-42376]AZB43057.1 hypothetical protein CEF21_12495 [Bacillus sp. FJAT-42376]